MFAINAIILQKSACGFCSVALEPPLPEARHCGRDELDGREAGKFRKIRGLGWRARWRDLAHWLVFVSVIVGFGLMMCSLTLIITEEICGRFGSFDGSNVCISRS